MTNNLFQKGADIHLYYPPVCEVILDEPQNIICESELDDETEPVGGIDGEW